MTNQAASVLKVLEIELKRLAVPVEYDFDCSDLSFSTNFYSYFLEKREKIRMPESNHYREGVRPIRPMVRTAVLMRSRDNLGTL